VNAKKKARFTRRSLGERGLVYHEIPETRTIRMFLPGGEQYIDIEWNEQTKSAEITGSDHLVVFPRLSNVIQVQVEK
jgi:hypothetical protein